MTFPLYARISFVFKYIPASPPSFQQPSFVFNNIPALLRQKKNSFSRLVGLSLAVGQIERVMLARAGGARAFVPRFPAPVFLPHLPPTTYHLPYSPFTIHQSQLPQPARLSPTSPSYYHSLSSAACQDTKCPRGAGAVMACPPLLCSCRKVTSAGWRVDSYRQTLCRLSRTFLRYRPFRLSTLDCLRRVESFKSVCPGSYRAFFELSWLGPRGEHEHRSWDVTTIHPLILAHARLAIASRTAGKSWKKRVHST